MTCSSLTVQASPAKLYLLNSEIPEFDSAASFFKLWVWPVLALVLYLLPKIRAPPAPAAVDVVGDGLDLEPEASEPEITDLIAKCQRLLNGFIAENPLIKAAMAARCLIIWGDQGAGKTLLADQLMTWRQVRRGDRIIVCNPHYHHDKENQLYAFSR